MKQLFKYFAPYLIWMIGLIALVYGQAHVNLALPDYTARIINDGIMKKSLNDVWSNGWQMLGIASLGGLCAIGVGYIAARISSGYVRKLRQAVFTKVEQFSLSEFDNFSSSSLVTRATNDMQQIQNVLAMILRMAFLAPFMGIGSIIKAYDIDSSMSWIVLVAVGTIVTIIATLFVVVVPKFTKIQNLVDKLSSQMREMLTGVRVIRAYNNDARQQKKFDITNQESTKLNIFVNRVIMMMQPLMTFIMGMTAVAVVWVGTYQIKSGNLEVGNLLALMQYVTQTVVAFLMISIIFFVIPRAAVSFKRVTEILNVKPKIVDAETPKHFTDGAKGVIEFKDVDFSYQGSEHPVLSKVSFTAQPGQTTAIIGGTGSGKSTILKLVPRLYDITGGSILIDGIDIRDVPQEELHTLIGYVPQKASLFTGTVASNIVYGRPKASKSEVREAAEIAQATEFVDKLPEKYDSPISQGGSNVSGGQKQRLSIARALAKQSKIYLFDDSFSALDFKTDAQLRKALEPLINDKTFIVVAQRISTIMHAEKIIVMEDGKVVGVGTHKQLMKSCKVYREIAESQLSTKELSEEV